MKKKIATHRVDASGGQISAPAKAEFLMPRIDGEVLIIPSIEDPDLGPSVINITSPIVTWKITLVDEGDEVDGVGEYLSTVYVRQQPKHIFFKRIS